MKLSLRNIGKISSADVVIDGITVIAGENNTGKSTVGKALYSVFNSFHNTETRIFGERRNSVSSVVLGAYLSVLDDLFPAVNTVNVELVQALLALPQEYTSPDSLTNAVSDTLLRHNDKFASPGVEATLEELSQRIAAILRLDEGIIIERILQKQLDSEFNHQISNLFSEDSTGSIQLNIQGKCSLISIDSDSVRSIDSALNLETEAVYIDDPFILDEVSYSIRRRPRFQTDHRSQLKELLLSGADKENVIEEIIASNKLEEIFNKLSSVCGGDVIRESSTSLVYRTSNSSKPLDVKNLSTGLKTFVILKLLLTSGKLKEKGTIILDEPEIHLHPEWQLLFAELVVLLQLKFGLHILLNTHSPYFLNAIEVYAAKYGIADRCKYYLAENKPEGAYIHDVTYEIEQIYSKLARPLQTLEDERYRNEES